MDFRERYENQAKLWRAAMDGRIADVWTALPAIVQSFDAALQTVTVQPAVRGTVRRQDGSRAAIELPVLPGVPVIFPGGGGYTLTFPIQPGDECIVVIASRCIDSWWLAGGIQDPADVRMHDLSDGFAVFAPRSKPRVLPAVSTGTVQLRSDAGVMYVEIDTPTQQIMLKSPRLVTIDAPHTVMTGDLVVMNSGGSAEAATFTGSTIAAGNVQAVGDVIAADISLLNHRHDGVRSGDSNTGPPVHG